MGLADPAEGLDVLLALLVLQVFSTLAPQLLEPRGEVLFEDLVDLCELGLLLLDGLDGLLLLQLEHARAGGLLDEAEDLLRLHVEHLRDPTLHDLRNQATGREHSSGQRRWQRVLERLRGTKKWGLLTFSWTEWKRFCTRLC